MSDQSVSAARGELSAAEQVFGPDHPHTTEVRIKLAKALSSAGRYADELPVRERILAELRARNGSEHVDTAIAAYNYGFSLYENDRAADGIPYLERAIEDIAPLVSADGFALFRFRKNLGTLYLAESRSAEAIKLWEAILAEQAEKQVVEDDELRAARLALADGYRLQTGPGAERAHAKGEELWRLIIETQERAGGVDDPATLRLRNRFAVFYDRLGLEAKALPLYRRTLADRERVLGAEHPDTLLSRSNLAICHDTLGEREAAAALFAELHQQRERLLGPAHKDTLDTLDRLAVCVYNLERYEEAATRFQKLVALRSEIGGEDDRTRTNYLNWLGWSHYRAGHRKQAVKILRRCLTDRERILGPGHADTMAARHNLADVLQAGHDYHRAIPLLERALADRAELLGPGRSETVKTRSLLAKCLIAVDRDDEGAALRREDVEAIEQERGPEDHETILALNRLGDAEVAAQRIPAALEAYARALATAERVLGPEHADTVYARHATAYRLQGLGRFADALPLFERVLDNYRRNRGAEHVRTLRVQVDIARCHDGQGLTEQALEGYRSALRTAEDALPSEHVFRVGLAADLREPLPAAWLDRRVLEGRELWQVGLGVMLCAELLNQGYATDVLFARRWLNRHATVLGLRRWWGIDDRADLLNTLTRLRTGGQRAALAERLGHQPVAWDVARYVDNVRDGAAAGYLDEPEAWDLLEQVTPLAAEAYGSWAEYSRDYLAGRTCWLELEPGPEQEGGEAGAAGFVPPAHWPTQHRRKYEALEQLLGPGDETGLFGRAPWDTPFTTEPKVVHDGDDAARR